MNDIIVNIGNSARVTITVLAGNGFLLNLATVDNLEVVFWVNGRPRSAPPYELINGAVVATASAAYLNALGDYSAQVRYRLNGVDVASERVYVLTVAERYYKSPTGINVAESGDISVAVSTPPAINKGDTGLSAYEAYKAAGGAMTEEEYLRAPERAKEAAITAEGAADEAEAITDTATEVVAQAQSAIETITTTNGQTKEAEAARVVAEQQRVTAESGRAAAEGLRVTAEAARETAEAKRKTDTAAVIAACNTTKTETKTAGDQAAAAATYANTQGGLASTATTGANTAATNANTKATYAQQQGDYAKAQGDYAKGIGDGLNSRVGALETNSQTKTDASLLTTSKTVVGAINETKAQVTQVQAAVAQPIKGLKFVSGDNTVNLKSPVINLGLSDFSVELYARTEGSNVSMANYITSASTLTFGVGGAKIGTNTALGTNGMVGVYMESPITGDSLGNSISINRTDNTTNLHHIVITRQGTLVSAYVNGKFVKSVTQDRVLDFSNFVFDIANTTYFRHGRVFNWCLDATNVANLYNGGRCDEYVLNPYYRKPSITNYALDAINTWTYTSGCSYDLPTGEVRIVSDGTYQAIEPKRAGAVISAAGKKKLLIEFEARGTGAISVIPDVGIEEQSRSVIINDLTSTYAKYSMQLSYAATAGGAISFKRLTACDVYIRNVKITDMACLLEYLPSSVTASGITDTSGQNNNGVFANGDKIERLYYAPYLDKIIGTAAPTLAPQAMGQRWYVRNGAIYEATAPALDTELAVSNWKQISN